LAPKICKAGFIQHVTLSEMGAKRMWKIMLPHQRFVEYKTLEELIGRMLFLETKSI
jgi:hypothetical protein